MFILYVLFGVFVIIGITETASYVIYHLLSAKDDCSTMLIIPIENSKNYEIIVRNAINKVKWMGSLRPCKILIVLGALKQNEKEEIENLVRGYDFIEIVEKESVGERIVLL